MYKQIINDTVLLIDIADFLESNIFCLQKSIKEHSKELALANIDEIRRQLDIIENSLDAAFKEEWLKAAWNVSNVVRDELLLQGKTPVRPSYAAPVFPWPFPNGTILMLKPVKVHFILKMLKYKWIGIVMVMIIRLIHIMVYSYLI